MVHGAAAGSLVLPSTMGAMPGPTSRRAGREDYGHWAVIDQVIDRLWKSASRLA
jgi:hypothetical protein